MGRKLSEIKSKKSSGCNATTQPETEAGTPAWLKNGDKCRGIQGDREVKTRQQTLANTQIEFSKRNPRDTEGELCKIGWDSEHVGFGEAKSEENGKRGIGHSAPRV